MPAQATQLMTVSQFQELPKPTGEFQYELRAGEMTKVTRPKLKHALLQDRLTALLKSPAAKGSLVLYEMAFRPLPEYELRVTDVGYMSPDRFAAADKEGNLAGAPDMVIEILSPSNTHAEMEEKQQLCLENGCLEFWVVNVEKKQVKISRRDGTWSLYRSGQHIPLPLLGGTSLAVDDIFR